MRIGADAVIFLPLCLIKALQRFLQVSEILMVSFRLQKPAKKEKILPF